MAGKDINKMRSNTMVLEDIREKGMRVLQRELGSDGLVQFIQLFSHGKGDYTRERHKILGSLTVDNIFNAVKGKKSR